MSQNYENEVIALYKAKILSTKLKWHDTTQNHQIIKVYSSVCTSSVLCLLFILSFTEEF